MNRAQALEDLGASPGGAGAEALGLATEGRGRQTVARCSAGVGSVRPGA
jgi:hypothetical protein